MQETNSDHGTVITLSIVTYNSEKWLNAFFLEPIEAKPAL